jgi:XTP/dITP diphosphohydrolase
VGLTLPDRFLIGSRNQKKIRELRELLAIHRIDAIGLDDVTGRGDAPDPAETATTFTGNAELKAAGYARWSGLWTLADDSGICLHALNGEPGVYSARWSGVEGAGADDANNAKMVRLLTAVAPEKRTAHYVCAIVLHNGERAVFVTEHEVHGQIVLTPAGSGGFGYDPFFFFPPFGKTFGEVSAADKHGVSHRGKALAAFGAWLAALR